MKTKCANCEKVLERRPCRMKTRNYCDAKCQMEYEYKTGIRDRFDITRKANDFMRKEGLEKFRINPKIKISKRKYQMIYVPSIGWRRLHTYLWEQENGKVPEGMVIHHKDLNKMNNSMDNLILMEKKEHLKLHYSLRVVDKYGRFIPHN